MRDDYKSGILPRRNLRRITNIQVAQYILWDRRNGVIMGWMMTIRAKNLHWQQRLMIQYVYFTRYKYWWYWSRWVPFDSSFVSLYEKSEDLYISIIKQLPSIIAMSNISSFDNSQKEYLFQHYRLITWYKRVLKWQQGFIFNSHFHNKHHPM